MTLWGGRFSKSPSKLMWDFTVDHADHRLLTDDVDGSIAHVSMLRDVGVIDADEAEALIQGLASIRSEAQQNSFEFVDSDEDVHTAVERRLVELVGPVGGKLHTGRSRNDQVALDLRLYLRRSGNERAGQIKQLIRVLADRAGEQAYVVVASYTHLQQAQSVSMGQPLAAYAWMLKRDAERIRAAVKRLSVSPLGAGAGGGSGLPLNPSLVAEHLGLPRTFDNSLDAVSARDFVAEYAFACAQAMVTLSRLSEDLALWATSEFGWVTLAESFSTGSSALPQKRNPDPVELVRGRTARVIGASAALLELQRALPMSYNRDLQEDKRLVFECDDTLAESLAVLTELLRSTEFHPPPPNPETAALDLAEALVARGAPFREAHEAVGRLIKKLEEDDRTLADATAADLTAADARFQESDTELTDPRTSVMRRLSPGSGHPEEVMAQVERLRR